MAYDAAVVHGWIHGAEHLTLTWAAFLFWWALIGAPAGGSVRRRCAGPPSPRPGQHLGALLTLAAHPLYALDVARPPAEARCDRQLAGVLMWSYGGLSTLVGALSLFVGWLRWQDRRVPATPLAAWDASDRTWADGAGPSSRAAPGKVGEGGATPVPAGSIFRFRRFPILATWPMYARSS